MATSPPKGKPSSKRVLIIAGVLGLAVVAYLYFRSSSSSSAAAPAASQDTTSPSSVPQTDSSGDSSSTDQASADLLGALAGENQQLMQSFLASENGLVSLAGSSVGAFTASTSAGEPSGGGSFSSTTSTPFATTAATAPSPSSSAPDFSAPAQQLASVLGAQQTASGPIGPAVVSNPVESPTAVSEEEQALAATTPYVPAQSPLQSAASTLASTVGSGPHVASPAPPVSGYSQKSTASQLH